MYDFAVFPILSTERLLLRQLEPEDAADVFTFRSDAEGQKYNSDPMTHISQALQLIYQLRDAYAEQKSLYWAVTLHEENRVIGLVGINEWSQRHHRAEVGYDLARAYWGYGLGSEAFAAVLDFCFNEMGFHHIEAGTMAVNTASIRMLERFGFQLEGLRRAYIYEDGQYYDSCLYGLLRSEYFGS